MASKLELLVENLTSVLGERVVSTTVALREVTIGVSASSYLETMRLLRDTPTLAFDQLIDLCGVDYSTYQGEAKAGSRYAVVVHLLSVANNFRLRVRVFVEDDEFPIIGSVVGIWASSSWFEREAFDLYGIVFDGHPDLRRILTDYGFVGHPFRKDFPVSGHVEMRYDPEQQRVVYEPVVTIEPREVSPRAVREAGYGGVAHG